MDFLSFHLISSKMTVDRDTTASTSRFSRLHDEDRNLSHIYCRLILLKHVSQISMIPWLFIELSLFMETPNATKPGLWFPGVLLWSGLWVLGILAAEFLSSKVVEVVKTEDNIGKLNRNAWFLMTGTHAVRQSSAALLNLCGFFSFGGWPCKVQVGFSLEAGLDCADASCKWWCACRDRCFDMVFPHFFWTYTSFSKLYWAYCDYWYLCPVLLPLLHFFLYFCYIM